MPRLVAMVAMLTLFGCSGAAPKLPTGGAGPAGGKAAEWIKKGDEAWQTRHLEPKLREALDAYVKAWQVEPSSRHALEMLSQSQFYLGERFLDDPDKKEEAHANGLQYAMLALLENPKIRERMDFLADKNSSPLAKRKHVGDCVEFAGKEDMAALYWLGVNWGRWGELRGIVRQTMDIPKIFAVMNKTLELDPTYHGGGPHRFFGAYYEAIPAMSGKDLEKSQDHFEKALQVAPKFLSNKVLYAQYYGVGADQEELYDRMLKEVLEAPDDLLPESRIDNDQAKRKAKDLVEKKDEIF